MTPPGDDVPGVESSRRFRRRRGAGVAEHDGGGAGEARPEGAPTGDRHGEPPPGAATRRPVDGPDDEFIEVRPEASPLRKGLAVLLIFGLVLGAAVGGGYWWYRRQVDPPGPPGKVVTVVIPKGSSTSGIGRQLERAGVISNATVFTFYVGRKHAGPFEAGRFLLRKNLDFDSAIKVLKAGPLAPTVLRVNIPEGLTVAQIEARLHRAVPRFTPALINAALQSGAVRTTLRPPGQTSWEGVLYPATYEVGPRTELPALLNDMAAKMETVTTRAGLTQGAAAVSQKYGIPLTPYEVLIVASLIQKEAGNPAEAPMIATVIYNRLKGGVALGIDATSNWLAEATGTGVDFASPSPYNTRRHKGLPPTPIAAPGEAAINAALHPADGSWLYYVLTERRKHTFATTNEQFIQAKRLCTARGLGCG